MDYKENTEGTSKVSSKLLSEEKSFVTSERENFSCETTKLKNTSILENVSEQREKSARTELLEGNIRLIKEESVEAVKIVRETNVTDKIFKEFPGISENITQVKEKNEMHNSANLGKPIHLDLKFTNDYPCKSAESVGNNLETPENVSLAINVEEIAEHPKGILSTDVTSKEPKQHNMPKIVVKRDVFDDPDTKLKEIAIKEKQGTTMGHFVVVAIDFGTTYSGYAFSFIKDSSSIHMMRKWEGGDPGVINQKTPTTLLLYPDGSLHSFGYTARDRFHDLDSEESKKWLYFEKFKMILHYSADLNRNTTIKAANGTECSALKVFTHALTFFKDHALQELSDQTSIKIINEDVRWVITVPAIWKEPAKQFMRTAAYDAGIASAGNPEQLLIALEPEAASLYVRRLRIHQLVPDSPHWRFPLHKKDVESTHYLDDDIKGMRYMIVDCGGGTVDITVHELDNESTKIKELYKATGGPFGSIGVDVEFEKILSEIFGRDFIEAFKVKRPVGWVDLMIAFESRKRAANPSKNNPLNVALPFSFIDYYRKYKGSQVEHAIRKYKDPNIKWSTQGMLRLSPSAMKQLFANVMESIKRAVGDVLNKPSVKDMKYIFLVGGFAESPILQQDIRQEFEHLVKVIIPQDVTLSILKGAVLYGLDPAVVNVRRSRMTYGVGVLNRFVHSKHPADKQVKKDGKDWCADIFDRFVYVDQPIALGDTVVRSYTTAKLGQKLSVINVYSSKENNPFFITDPDVSKCGTLCLDLSNILYHQSTIQRREIQTKMTFGETEIKVSALDVTTGLCVNANIDFLNH